jgi:hypothetical protein
MKLRKTIIAAALAGYYLKSYLYYAEFSIEIYESISVDGFS